MKFKFKRAGFDLDDCLFKTADRIFQELGIDPQKLNDVKYHDIEKSTGIPDDVVKAAVDRAITVDNLEPIKDAFKVIDWLSSKGLEIYIVSHRPKHLIESTHRMISYYTNNIPIERVILTQPTHEEDNSLGKSQAVKDYNLEVFLDDKSETISDLLSKFYDDLYLIIYDQPWNRSFAWSKEMRHPLFKDIQPSRPTNVIRANDWGDVKFFFAMNLEW